MQSLMALPPIVVSGADHERLFNLASSLENREPGAAALLGELARAEIAADDGASANAAGMSNLIDFDYDGSVYRDFRLVYPSDADFSNGRLSVLSHVGAMLIGLSAGQSIEWQGPAGRAHRLTVLAVRSAN